MSGTPALPSFSLLSNALRETTERLASELVAPSARAPAWNDLQWRVARAAIAIHGCTALLAHRLRWRGPAEWQDFLEQQRAFTLQRERQADALLGALDPALRAANMGAVALKGSALRRLGLYQPGERPMSDVDIFVDAASRSTLPSAMNAIGYRAAYNTPRHAVFEPCEPRTQWFGEHPDNRHEIDVHDQVREQLPLSVVDITHLLRPSLREPGLNTYPDRAALFTHLLLHAAGNIRAHSLRLLQLHDLALLSAEMRAGDWQRLLEPAEHGHWWMWPPLSLVSNYYPGRIPANVLDATRKSAGPVLRRAAANLTLTEASLSNLRIAAFPGISWSRSPLEALRYARSRLLPSRAGLAELEQMLKVRPQYGQVRWYDQNHLVRMVRWLFTRPPRVQTLLSLRAVLDEGAVKP